MEFNHRLQKAVDRGKRRGQKDAQEAADRALTEDDLKRMHSKYRLVISDHIEQCLQQLPQHFPGFNYETIYGERGWGGACSRDDLRLEQGRRDADYSRLEVTVRPFSSYHVVDLSAKGTIQNKEIFNRHYYEKITDFNEEKFLELIDAWVLDFAELYAAKS